MTDAFEARLRRLPKAELHVHLDGSLRPSTMLELARERDIRLPAEDARSLAGHMLVSEAARLEEYLERFDTTLAVMQDEAALERIAHELVVDHADEGVTYLEIRFCPLLSTDGGLTGDEVVAAVLAGMRSAERELATEGHSIRSGFILCGLRSHAPGRTLETAELAVAFADRGVCGFDLAGAEAGFPVSLHVEACELAARAGIGTTLHAGEGYGPSSIRQALDLGHARRIGHGTRLFEDPALMERVRAEGVPLEVCLTSNVQTRVVSDISSHPALDYLRGDIPISLGADNRLMSGVTLTDEYRKAHGALGMTWTELVRVARTGFEHAFVDDETRDAMLRTFDDEAAAL